MAIEIHYGKRDLGRPMRDAQKASAEAALGTQYALTMINQSAQPWVFYVYQKLPAPVADVFSLAWFASPYQIRVGDQIKFSWEIDYNFVWSDTGVLIPGVTFDASGKKDCDPSGANTTTFSMDPGPGLSDPVQGPPAGSLVINDANNVPSNRFSVGIGMSGTGTYVVQAGPNLKHTFTPTPSYWVAAGINVQIGTVLDIQTVTQTAEARFEPNVFDLNCILQADNTWNIQPG